MTGLRARVVGEHAVLVECAGHDQVRAVDRLARARLPGAADIVPGAATVLIDGVADPAEVCEEVAGWSVPVEQPVTGDLVELPVRYDGPDLADVAERWDVSTAEAVRLHQEREYVVAFCGFAPGFAYCTGLDRRLAVPRLDSPRSSVPAGSVGVAGEYTGIYPTTSPGGWRLIGSTTAVLWRPDRDPPTILVPGTRVRFVDA